MSCKFISLEHFNLEILLYMNAPFVLRLVRFGGHNDINKTFGLHQMALSIATNFKMVLLYWTDIVKTATFLKYRCSNDCQFFWQYVMINYRVDTGLTDTFLNCTSSTAP